MGVTETPGQLTFPVFGDKPRKTDRFFLALFPDPAAAREISGLARRLSSKYGIGRATTPANRLHVSLFHVGDFIGVPDETLERVRAAADSVNRRSFRASFDRVKSFERKSGRRPLVLLCSDQGLAAMRALYTALGAALGKHGFATHPAEFFVPHVTLLRDELPIEESMQEISWGVDEFVLVHRRLSGFEYRRIGRWELH